ncbi:putative TRAP transporter small permease protein [Betaproteobacteria bacterium]|nr:putative TRAP transporter small permease protein [Betaproteobacteria bacterium]
MLRIFNKLLEFTTAAAMGVIVLLVFMNVAMRYILNTGLTWSEEIAVNLFVWVIFLGAILAGLEGLHIKVDMLTSKLPKKLQKICLVISSLCVLFALGVLIVGGIGVVEVYDKNVSAATGLPFSYVAVALLVSAVCLVFITLRDTIKELFSD